MTDAGYPSHGGAARLSREMSQAGQQITPRAIGKWLNGDGMPDTKRLELLSRLVGRSVEWLLTGKDRIAVTDSSLNTSYGGSGNPPNGIKPASGIPVVDLATLTDADISEHSGPAMMAVSWTICPVKHGFRTFAFRMNDDSMACASAKSIPKDFFVWVDPEQRSVEHDRPVLAQIESGQLVVAQYMKQAGREWLHLLNPAYPPLSGQFEVVGRVIFKGEET